jgi:hypothetical protein
MYEWKKGAWRMESAATLEEAAFSSSVFDQLPA